MKRRFDQSYLDGLKRQRNQRADDSAISAAIAEAEPELARAQFKRSIRILEEFFETALDETGTQSAQNILARIHQITGERRRNRK